MMELQPTVFSESQFSEASRDTVLSNFAIEFEREDNLGDMFSTPLSISLSGTLEELGCEIEGQEEEKERLSGPDIYCFCLNYPVDGSGDRNHQERGRMEH